MSAFTQKTLLIAAFSGCLYADFLGFSVSDAKSSLDKVKNTKIAGYSIGDAKDIAGKFKDIKNQYKEFTTNGIFNTTTDFIFNDPTLNKYWQENMTWATGTMEKCYKFSPKKKESGVNGDICSLLQNTSLDPCSALPDKIGYYTKLSKEERLNASLPFNKWCKEFKGVLVDAPVEDIEKKMGLSGKSKDEALKSVFNSKSKKKESVKANNLVDDLVNTSLEKQTKYSTKTNSLMKTGHGHVVANEIKRIVKQNGSITKKELDEISSKVVFSSTLEYSNDLVAKTSSDYAIYRHLFNYLNHVDVVNSQFSSMNTQKKAAKDKKDFIEEYIEHEETGIRVQYHKWAEEEAEAEIMYELPLRVKKYYASFDKKILLNTTNLETMTTEAKISIINNDIVTQQRLEELIMLKWRNEANVRADSLKVKLTKNMYASEVFDEERARAEIYQMMSAE